MSGGEHSAGDPIDALQTSKYPAAILAGRQGKPNITASQKKTVPLIFEGAGETLLVEAALGSSLYEVAREHGIALEAACRGECACSTCHVKLSVPNSAEVQPVSEEEQDMIELASGNDSTSRLGCQLY